MRDKVLTDLFTSKELTALLDKMEPADLRDDLRQELAVILCEMPEPKLLHLCGSGEIRFYVARTVVQMIQSKNSRFYYKFRKYKEFERPGYIAEDVSGYGDGDDGEKAGNDYPVFIAEELTADEREANFTRLVEQTLAAIEALPFYHNRLLNEYLTLGSASAVVEDMKVYAKGRYIPKRSILKAVKEAKTIIKKSVPLC
jgi:hypothetical protein